MSENVRDALYAALQTTGAITSQLGGTTEIHHAVAPPEATYPLIILNQQGKTRSMQAFGDKADRSAAWMVKGVAITEDSDVVDAIGAAVDARLNEGSLSLSAGSIYRMFWESDVEYTETEDGQQIRHSGGVYRLLYRES